MFKHALLAAVAALALSQTVPAFASSATETPQPSQCSAFTTLFIGDDFEAILAGLESFIDLSCNVNNLYSPLDQAHICDYTNTVLTGLKDDEEAVQTIDYLYHQTVAEIFVCDGEHIEIPKG